MNFLYRYIFLLITILSFICCGVKQEEAVLFEVFNAAQTGLNFSNTLKPSDNFNMFKYMYFYNGSGVGAGDFNNDGLIDLFFAANQEKNKLYLNTGNLHFKDITNQSGMIHDGAWSTGVSIVDINNDGLLDIYICRVGQFENLKSHNLLLVCTNIDKEGIPHYQEQSKKYGLDFSGFSTQAAFFDYDMDGDLDCFLLNHSIHQNGLFAERKIFIGTYSELSGDRLYNNNGGEFTDITKLSGINSSAISYGLGIAVADINVDGYPDLYIGNDFHENDYLYINQKNGRFKEISEKQLMHTSQFSMGVDVADINNDAYPEIISMDMLPNDPYILKRSEGEDSYDIFNLKINYGYSYQYTRNNLQYNLKNGKFAEIGLYAGVAATDWSWAPLWADFDNDGKKDLFISNGIPKRMNDIDYINHISNSEMQGKIKSNSLDETDKALIDKFPQIKIPNKFYLNKGKMQFADLKNNIKGELPSFSNGAICADLDNDGDLDFVVSNIDEPAVLYANRSNDNRAQSYASIQLKGDSSNSYAVGAKLVLFSGDEIHTYEKNPTKGFQSSMEAPLHIGFNKVKIDTAFLIWPDNTYQKINLDSTTPQINITYSKGLPHFNYATITNKIPNPTYMVRDITDKIGMNYTHIENSFNEFNREPLLPHMLSTEGPALAVGDMNNDGLEDVFIGSSKGFKNALLLQQPSGKFRQSTQIDLQNDSTYEDVDAVWVDVNRDTYLDLIIVSGGNEYYGQDAFQQSRVYLNNKKGLLTKLKDPFPLMDITASCIAVNDFNNDGAPDLFIGARAQPFGYGTIPRSYLLLNNKQGKFTDITDQYAMPLATSGMIRSAQWIDMNADGKKDLLLSKEWGGIEYWLNTGKALVQKMLTTQQGWWNFALPVDLDKDGDLDVVAGNLGLNSRLKASTMEPVKMYYGDFDGNEKKEQILTYFLEGRELVFANKAELEKQMPVLKKKFLYAEQFAKAELNDMFPKQILDQSKAYHADFFEHALFLNNGQANFTAQLLPWETQLSTAKDAMVVDANGDELPDILLVGNYYENNIQMGRYDASTGMLLINKGNGKLESSILHGLAISGQVRKIKSITIAGKKAMILARNNESVMVIAFDTPKNSP